jgi:hypothetical protein
MLDGVLQQVLQQGEQGPAISLPRHIVGGSRHRQAHMGRFRHALQVGDGLVSDLAHPHDSEMVVVRLAGFGQQQKLLHLARHVFHVAQQRVAAVLAVVAQLDLRADQRKGRLQLVGGGREKLLLHAIAPFEPLQNAIETDDQRGDLCGHRFRLQSGLNRA